MQKKKYMYIMPSFVSVACPMIGKMNNKSISSLFVIWFGIWYWNDAKRLQKGPHPFGKTAGAVYIEAIYLNSEQVLWQTPKRFSLSPDCDGDDERGRSHGIHVHLSFLFFHLVQCVTLTLLLAPKQDTPHTAVTRKEKKTISLTPYSKWK